MAALWNPRRLLDVDPDGPFTCVGTTQKGARCRNFYFSSSDLSKASNILNRMAASDPWDARAQLSHLAELTLCPRWHRKPGYSQVESMKRKWWSIIVSTYPEPRPRPTEPTTAPAPIQERRPIIIRQPSESVGYTSATRSLLSPPPSPLPAPRRHPLTPSTPVVRTLTLATSPTPTVPTQAPTDQPVRSRATTLASVSSPPSPTSTPAALITPPQSPRQAPSRSSNDSSSPSPPATEPITATTPSRTPPPPPPSTPRVQRPQSTTAWLQLTPERAVRPSPPACPHSSRRKPLAEECPVCNEDMHCLDDAVWCRARCGSNLHRGCFAEWRRACLDREAAVTCVFCRAPWKYEWED